MGQTDRKRTLIFEKLQEPKLVRPKHICRFITILTILCMTTFYCGYCLAYITALGSTNLAIVYGEVTKIPILKAFLISCVPFGVSFGTFLNPWILPLASRRFLQGVVAGLLLALIPNYVREISPKQINKRGIFGIFGQLFVIIGFMVAFGFNTILLESNVDQIVRWRFVISMNFFAILIIIIGIITKIIPESPNSLIPKGKIQDAKAVIGLFHRQNCIEEVYQEKIKEIQDTKKPPAPPAKDRPIVHTILTFELPIMHQMTGVNAYISQMGFVTSVFDNKFGDYVPFMMGSIQVVTAIYALVYLTKVTRKSLVLIGNLGMSLCCIGIGVSYELTNKFQQMFWVIVALIVIFMGINGATLVPGVWTYIPEIATKQEIRWSQVTGWFATGTSVALFIYIGQTFGYAVIFLTFGLFTMICFVFNSVYMISIKPKLKDVVNVELANIQLENTSTDEDKYDLEKE